MRDDLKAPLGCPAIPAKLAPAALNLYLAENVGVTKDPNTIMRAAYAFGSGVTSIGLNPETMRLLPFFPDLIALKKHVTEVVHDNAEWKAQMKGKQFNVCSIKVYYWLVRVNEKGEKRWVRKDVKWHVDIERNSRGEPKDNNSQEPNTPVAILTFGSDKIFSMREHKSPDVYLKSTNVQFKQTNGTLIVLDPRDEEIKKGKHWRHMSECGDDKQGVTFSLLFRICRKRVEVRLDDNTLVDKSCTEKKAAQYEAAPPDSFDNDVYVQTVQDVDQKIGRIFDKFP
ncbi:MAG: hypothetical protein SGARI_000969 [Bacillariaceae sp.]